jgi:Microtubule-binding protein MIP-T3 C-terminal region
MTGPKKELLQACSNTNKLRCAVQGVASNLASLVKTLDFLQEDTDAMLAERTLWQSETQSNATALKREYRYVRVAADALFFRTESVGF